MDDTKRGVNFPLGIECADAEPDGSPGFRSIEGMGIGGAVQTAAAGDLAASPKLVGGLGGIHISQIERNDANTRDTGRRIGKKVNLRDFAEAFQQRGCQMGFVPPQCWGEAV